MKANLGIPAFLVIALASAPAHAKGHFNSTQLIAPDHAFADLDGDGVDEWVVMAPAPDGGATDRVTVLRTDFVQTMVAQNFTFGHTRQLFTGRFLGGDRDVACFVQELDKQLVCERISATTGALERVLFQPNFIQPTDLLFAGDFTGDGKDELLVLTDATQDFRLYTVLEAGQFAAVPDFRPSDLPSVLSGSTVYVNVKSGITQLFVGNFSNLDGRGRRVDDVLLIDRRDFEHAITVYAAIPRDELTGCTFETSFVSIRDDRVQEDGPLTTVAEIDGDGLEELVVATKGRGPLSVRAYRFPDNGNHLEQLAFDIGQLELQDNEVDRWFGPGVFQHYDAAPFAAKRDDFMFEKARLGGPVDLVRRVDARWDGAPRYWWAYNQVMP